MAERVLTKMVSAETAIEWLRENAVRACEAVSAGLAERLQSCPDALDSLRVKIAPSLTPKGFPRSRAFANMVQEASPAVVCALAFARMARDRGMIDPQLACLPLLAQALDPDSNPPAHDGPEDDAPQSAEPSLWGELKAMLVSFHGGTSRRRGHPHRFSPLLHDLPPELELSDGVLENALFHISRACGHGGEPVAGRALDPASVPVRGLGDIYEAASSGSPYGTRRNASARNRIRASRRKAVGMYYTPDTIVQYIVSGTLDRLMGAGAERALPGDEPLSIGEPLSVHAILNLKVLDPASGSGHFLLAAAEYLARACVARLVCEGKVGDDNLERSNALGEYRKLVAARCIHGVDIDPVAVELAGLSLWLFASDPGAPLSDAMRHLRCGNSLHRFDWAKEFPDPIRGFDAVIGNPPYLSFSGRQKPGGNEWIGQLDPDSKPGGWQTMHGLFMLKSMELAKKSGLVSMVVPDQVGHLKGYEPLRSRMLEEGRLLEVRYWGEGVFENVTSPALTFIARKLRGASGGNPESPEVEETVIIDEKENATCFSPLPGQEWFTSPSRKVLKRMSQIHVTTSGFSDPGVHTGNVARKLVLDRPSRGSVPLLEGRQIHPFRCEEPRRRLDLSYKPGKGEYFRVSAQETYRSTDIILRQTASRPIAARHVHRCHFRNSVLALKVSGDLSVEYLLGVLNSAAAAFLYRASSFESRQVAFPQIKVRLLRGLPIPDPLLRKNCLRVSEIEKIVRRIERAPDEAESTTAKLMSRLDNLVWSLYGLPGDPPPG